MTTASPTLRPLANTVVSPDFPQVEKSLKASLYHCSSPASVSTCSYSASCVKNSESFGSTINQKMSDRDNNNHAVPVDTSERQQTKIEQPQQHITPSEAEVTEPHVERWADEYDDDEEFSQQVSAPTNTNFQQQQVQSYDTGPAQDLRFKQSLERGGSRRYRQHKQQKSFQSSDGLSDIWNKDWAQRTGTKVSNPSLLSRQLSQVSKGRDGGEVFHSMKSSSPSILKTASIKESGYAASQSNLLTKSRSAGNDVQKDRVKVLKNIIHEVVDSATDPERNVNIFGSGRPRVEVIQTDSSTSLKEIAVKPGKVDPFGGAKAQDIFQVEQQKQFEKDELKRQNQLRNNNCMSSARVSSSTSDCTTKSQVIEHRKHSNAYDTRESVLNMQYDASRTKVTCSETTDCNGTGRVSGQVEHICVCYEEMPTQPSATGPSYMPQVKGALTNSNNSMGVYMVPCELASKYKDTSNQTARFFLQSAPVPFGGAAVMVPPGTVSGSPNTPLGKPATTTFGYPCQVQAEHNANSATAQPPPPPPSPQPQQFYIVQHSSNPLFETAQTTLSSPTRYITPGNVMDFQLQSKDHRNVHMNNQSIEQADKKNLDPEATNTKSGVQQHFCYNKPSNTQPTYGVSYHEKIYSSSSSSSSSSSAIVESETANNNSQPSSSSPSAAYAINRVLASPAMYSAAPIQPQSGVVGTAGLNGSEQSVFYSSSNNGQYSLPNGYNPSMQQHDFSLRQQKQHARNTNITSVDASLCETPGYHTSLSGFGQPEEQTAVQNFHSLPPQPTYQVLKKKPSMTTNTERLEKQITLPELKHQTEATSGQHRARRLKLENKPMCQELVKTKVDESASKVTTSTFSDDQIVTENKHSSYSRNQSEYTKDNTFKKQAMPEKDNISIVGEISTNFPVEFIDKDKQKEQNSGSATSATFENNANRNRNARQPKYPLYRPHKHTSNNLDGNKPSNTSFYSQSSNRNNSNGRGGFGSYEQRNIKYKNSTVLSNESNTGHHHHNNYNKNNYSNSKANCDQRVTKSTTFAKSSTNNSQQFTQGHRNWKRHNVFNAQGVGNKDQTLQQQEQQQQLQQNMGYDSNARTNNSGTYYNRQGSQRRQQKGQFSNQKPLEENLNNEYKPEKKWLQRQKLENNSKVDTISNLKGTGSPNKEATDFDVSYIRGSLDNKTFQENQKTNYNVSTSTSKRKFGNKTQYTNSRQETSQTEQQLGTTQVIMNTQQTPIKMNAKFKVTNRFQLLDSETEDGKND